MQMNQLRLAWHQDHLTEKLQTLESDPFNPADMNGRALTGHATVRERDRWWAETLQQCSGGRHLGFYEGYVKGGGELGLRNEGEKRLKMLFANYSFHLVGTKMLIFKNFFLSDVIIVNR